MFENFAEDEATLIHALLNRFPTFEDKILLHDIDVMPTVHLSDFPRVQEKVKPSSGSNLFTYNLPHYTASM